jgi:O-antigen/teichoic acid export membrane protein
MTTLKKRAVHAGLWTMGGFATSQALRLGSNLILTRLLFPSMFGVMAIVSAIMAGLVLFTDLGLRENIIQSHRGDDPVFLNTVWSIQIMRGLSLWLVSVLFGVGLYIVDHQGWLSSNTVYASPMLPFLIPVSTLSVLFSAFEPTWTSIASRRLQQSKITLIDLSSQLGSLVVMLVWVWLDRTIWALVAGGVSSSIIRNIIVYYIVPGEPNKWHLEREAVLEILHFGKWIFMASIVGFLFNNGDRLLLGGLISAKELGVYTVAFFLVNSISHMVSRLVGNAAFPALSETGRERPAQLRQVYYHFRLLFDSGLLFFAGFFYMTGEWIIHLLYDSRYHEAGRIMEILALLLVAVRYNLADQCFVVLGKPKYMTFLIAVRTTTMFLLLPWAYRHYQLTGAIWAVVASYFVSIPVTLYFKHKFHLLHLWRELYTLPVLLLGVVVGKVFLEVATRWR